MTRPDRRPRPRLALVVVPALVGAGLGGDAYVGPETGVDGTWGALLAFAGALAVAAGGLLAMLAPIGPGLRRTLHILLGLGALLTAVAAWMLMQDVFAVAMLLSFAGLLLALATPRSRSPA